MSLATRCTACETVFRVVQDQLKVSDGWVRCGRCDAVFNALESLFDLEREGLQGLHQHAAPDRPATPPAPPPEPAPAPTPAVFEAEADVDVDVDVDDIELTTDWSAPEPPAEPEPEPQRADETVPEPEPAPTFLSVAPRRSRWHTPPARLALTGVSLALLLGLTAQALHHFRDQVAARWPQSLALLTPWCKLTGCAVAPLRQIDDVAVESTALTRTSEADTFTLAVALRNHGALRVALPALDLTLTDADGQLVARRALAPGDFPGAAATLAPGAEAMLKVTLATGSPRVRGYTVEVFYP